MMSYLFSINVNHWCQPGMQVTFLFEIKKKNDNYKEQVLNLKLSLII